MKMPYEKPMMAIERYELTQSIATCELKIGFWDSQCVMKDPDATNSLKSLAYAGTFIEGYCNEPYTDGDNTDGLCYHTNVTIAFNS